MKLRQPIRPEARLHLTTPLHVLLVGVCIVAGVWLYARGYTYEGSVLAYMLGGVIFAYPYYSARFTSWMTFLVLGSLVPATIWLQNKGVENVLWTYPVEKPLLLHHITKTGEGFWRWSRHLWLGNDMPVMEYLFYPLFGLFHMTGFALYTHFVPTHRFEEEHRWLRHAFLGFMIPLFAVFIWVYFKFPNPNATDYTYWMTGLIGFATTFLCWAVSGGFKSYTRTPAFWIWAIGVGLGFMTAWEFFHVCINHDWVYNLKNTFPAAYEFNGAGIPFTDFFGYLVTATVFQALMYFFMTRLGHIVVKNTALVPFASQRHRPKSNSTPPPSSPPPPTPPAP
ncbi:MAG TPA: hypothetical protein VI454_07995 [Verrucomicrobiae bacterium]|jgi:hypothetical protein